MGGTGYDGFENVIITPGDKIIVSGYTNSFDGDTPDNHGSEDGWISVLDENGVIQWNKAYGAVGGEGIKDLEPTTDGGFIIAGVKLPLYGNNSTADSWIVRLNPGQLATNTFDNVSVKLYPNPAKKTFAFSVDPNIVIKSVSIYNMLGQLMQVNDNIAETIDVSGLKAGNYFVKLVRDNGSTVEKFVKE